MLPLRILAAVPFVLLSYALVRHSSLPPAVAVACAAFVVAAAFRPAGCLTLVAAFAPLLGAFAWQWSRSVRWSEAIVLSFLTGALLHVIIRPRRDLRWHAPEFIGLGFAAVVVASWMVELAMMQYATDYPGHFVHTLWRFFTRDFYADPGAFAHLNDAMVLVESIALLLFVRRFGARDPSLATVVLRMTVVAATASAALNLQRVGQILLQNERTWASVIWSAPMRLSVLHTDVNAAGSYFALVLPIALGLGIEKRSSVGWLPCAAAIGAGLWFTGSRTAMAAAAVAICLSGAVLVKVAGSPRRRRLGAGALVAAIVLIGVAVAMYPTSRNVPVSAALDVRADMATVALRLFATRPLFGIGVGTFWQRSAEYIPARLQPFYLHENAHNNFLQILAELGGIGLALFLALLAVCTKPFAAARSSSAAVLAGTIAGLSAFLLTCLTGHPLLTREVAYPFWLVLGALSVMRTPANAAAEESHVSSPRWNRRSMAAAVTMLAVSIPIRVTYEKRHRDFENVGVGYSVWTTSDDGIRFRWAQLRSRLFVPANASSVVIPLRLGPRAAAGARVDLYLDGRLANTVVVTRERWTSVRIVLAPGRRAARYRMIEIVQGAETHTEQPRDAEALLMVGRPVAS